MTDAPISAGDGPRRLSPLLAMRRYWVPSAALVAVGLVLGVAYASSQPVTYAASARVRIGSGTLVAQNISYYEQAAEQLAATYARGVTIENYKPLLPATVGDVAGVDAITATQVPSSPIIEIDVSAADSATAVKVAAFVEQSFVKSINATAQATSPDAIRARISADATALADANGRVTQSTSALAKLQASVDATPDQVTAAQTTVNQATAAQQVAQANYNADSSALQSALQATALPENTLTVVTTAGPAGSNRTSLLERYALLGIAVGVLLALLASLGLDRRRVRAEQAALEAAAPLADVTALRADPPDEATAATPATPATAATPPAAPAGPVGSDEAPAPRPARSRRSLRRARATVAPRPSVADHRAPETVRETVPDERPEAAEEPLADPYLAQALRTSLEQQQREATARRDAEAEAHRRAVRDALQRMSREREASAVATDTRSSLLEAPGVPEVEPAPVPTPAPTYAVGPVPDARDESADDGPIADVRPLFGERPSRERGRDSDRIRVFPSSADEPAARTPWSPLDDDRDGHSDPGR